jgi:hypothetical protein
MVTVGCAYDNVMAESFFASLEANSSNATVSRAKPRLASRSSHGLRVGTPPGAVTADWDTSPPEL